MKPKQGMRWTTASHARKKQAVFESQPAAEATIPAELRRAPLSITTDCCVLNDVVRVGFAAQCNQDQPLSGQVHTIKPIIGCHSAEMPSRYRHDIVQREENHTRTRPQLHVRFLCGFKRAAAGTLLGLSSAAAAASYSHPSSARPASAKRH